MHFIARKIYRVKTIVLPLSAIFLGTLLFCLASGLLTSLLGVRLNATHTAASVAGMIMASYYVGYVWAALTAQKIINRVGHIRAFGTYLSIVSIFSLLHYFSGLPVLWGILRFLEGYCIGAATMCLESWLNSKIKNDTRGRIVALYMITSYVGSSMAQLMLNIPDPNQVVLYIVISILFSLALLPVALTSLSTPDIKVASRMSLFKLYKITPVGVIGCITSGLMVGNFFALGAVYTGKIGLDIQDTSLFMFCGILGGMTAQLPVGRFSDKRDRRIVLMWCCLLLSVVSVFFPHFMEMGRNYIAACAFALGACALVIYPVCVSHINDLVTDEERVHASGQLILLQGVGMIFGPIIISFAMERFGDVWYMWAFTIISFSFVLFTIRHRTAKPDIGYIQITKTEAMPVTPTVALDEEANIVPKPELPSRKKGKKCEC